MGIAAFSIIAGIHWIHSSQYPNVLFAKGKYHVS